MAQAETVIYDPPAPNLPYLVVTITSTGVNAVAVKSRTEARVMVALHKRQGRD
ncbi:MAG: hypothetical protein QOD25_927 [Alphaproteobacteria bacterium]|jgi:hypothetical protein|nr:hypothetical protein [Alphaproteobacteria bacterium]